MLLRPAARSREQREGEGGEDVEQSDGEPGVEERVQSEKVGFTDRMEGLTPRLTCFFFFPVFFPAEATCI